mmetsp:Transcript_10768/g.44872  ORF Transcript_10768/g.44872 Transcript_10768/m.44872 type:complete len:80 (-) Transcript_10768:155-394(-)
MEFSEVVLEDGILLDTLILLCSFSLVIFGMVQELYIEMYLQGLENFQIKWSLELSKNWVIVVLRNKVLYKNHHISKFIF